MLLLKLIYLLAYTQDNLLCLVHVSASPFFMVRISKAGREWFIPAANRQREAREAEWVKISAAFKHQILLVSLSQTQPYLNSAAWVTPKSYHCTNAIMIVHQLL